MLEFANTQSPQDCNVPAMQNFGKASPTAGAHMNIYEIGPILKTPKLFNICELSWIISFHMYINVYIYVCVCVLIFEKKKKREREEHQQREEEVKEGSLSDLTHVLL